MFRAIRIAACLVALALLVLLVQPHHHAALNERGCVACVVRAVHATPARAPLRAPAPILTAQASRSVDPHAPHSAPAPTPRAQGPPRPS